MVKDDKTVVVAEAKIKTEAGEVTQKEIYYLLKVGETWPIDGLIATDEEIDLRNIQL